MSPVRHILGISLILALGCASVWAQGTAQISGSVADPTGALLPGVEVTATQTATGIVRTTVSNETGSYVLPNLPTGPYRLEVALPGFRTYIRTGIVLEVNSNPVLNVTLEVGQVAETIEVQANAALVETRNVGVGQIMESERILELPLNGRNVTELITLSGAAVQTGSSSTRSMPGQPEISVAGGLSSGVAYSLDGAFHNNAYDNLNMPLPFPDALGEFKVETSALSASQGQHSAAQVNAVTKSGTNEYHGSLFEFVRNDLFNAREYFARTNSTLKRNQFGGTLGGPIVRNKLFFFGGYQGTIERQDPANFESFVPTEAMLRGDFSTAASGACGRPVTLRAPFVNNQVSPDQLSPAALNIASRLPKPLDECGLVTYGIPHGADETQVIGRADWQATDAHSIFGRVVLTHNSNPIPFEQDPNILNARVAGNARYAHSYAVGDTWLVSPETVVATRLATNYVRIKHLGPRFFDLTEMGVKNFFSYIPRHTWISVSNGFTIGRGTQAKATFGTFSAALNTDVSLARGNHQWSVGGALAWIDSNTNGNVFSSGFSIFSGSRTGLGLADFLTGRLTLLRQATPNTDYMRKWYSALYITDSWRVTPQLTLNYGVRWEPDTAETLTHGLVSTYSDERRAARSRSRIFLNSPPGFHYPGDEGFPGKRGRDRNWWTFAPRFGFAWDVTGDGRTSVRGSAGIAYDYPNAQFHLWTSITPPFGMNVSVFNASLDDPWASLEGGNPFPLIRDANTPFVPFGSFTTMGGDFKPAQHQTWNLTMQRQLAQDWLVSASYMGSHTIHIIDGAPLNPATYFPGVADASGNCSAAGFTLKTRPGATCSSNRNVNLRRRLSLIDFEEVGQFVANHTEIQSVSNASYNGLLLNVRKRAARGLTLNWNYTWSHCIGPQQAELAGGTGVSPTATWIFPNDRDRSRGNCPSDRRHVTNLTAVAEMPQFENTTLRHLASGWRLSTIYRYSTGSYMSVTAGDGLDLARNGTNVDNQPALYLGGDPVGDRSARPRTFWINRDAFAPPAVGTFGNAGTRSIPGPNRWDFDVALTRVFQFLEDQQLEFRAEAYNVLNSFRPENPNSEENNRFFGQLRSARDPRILQFALKYVF